ncbi:MAG: type 4a pilus biogenesis protein PilO [Actinobacteria bacterium]|nr:type 4a pilus biogenesis protein PilO [Actinomycetota bacterium]
MKKRDILILIVLGVLVLLVAWWFLIITPIRDDTASKDNEYQTEKQAYDQNFARAQRLDEERTAAKQAASDLLKLNKLIPADSQVPSMIVELQATANDAGIKFMKIVPDTPVAGTTGATIVPISMDFQGDYIDVNDFLYRVENYARMEGNDVTVSGRLINVMSVNLSKPAIGDFPQVLAKLSADAYMTSPPPASKTAAPRSADTSGGGGGNTSGGAGTGP